MTNRFNPLHYPACLMQPNWLALSSWTEHVPFAFSLIEMIQPRVVMELGVYTGTSYCGFCQAIDQLGLASRAYGVDTWQGDPHSGPNGPELLGLLRAHHDPRYGRFSRLIPSDFDSALPQFADGSIDLLHIDGYHTYEAVRHDFESWLPKMSERGVMLFHDTNVHEKDFGVWKFWQELKQRHRSMEFLHEHGLGVLAVGRHCPESLGALLECGEDEMAAIRDFYSKLGQRITKGARRQESERQLAELYRREHVHSLQIGEAARAMAELRSSRSFRCAQMLARFSDKLAPAGSLRRGVFGLAKRCVNLGRPGKMLAPFKTATHGKVGPR